MLDILSKELRFPIGAVVGLLRNPLIASVLLGRLPSEGRQLFGALLTNTVSATMLKAGVKVNVIPSQAEANLDCRLLPGQTAQDAIGEIRAVMGERIAFEPIMTSPGAQFSMDTPLYRLLENATRRMDPAGIVMPMLMPGATDAAEYQKVGMTVYGFTPGIMPEGISLIKMAHGHDERMPIAAIRSGLPTLWEVVSKFCCI
jgi:acetylornithine deacetylase/succinyl-diaminopimelate desuccinylase-like protein